MPFSRDAVKPDDLVFQRDFTRHLLRKWLKHLNGCECACVLFIFDRTIQWGKLIERIPLRHFTDGIVSRDLKVHSEGVNYSRRQIMNSLKSLEEAGLIEVSSTGSTSPKMYGIKIEATEDDLKKFSNMKKIATPKRKKQSTSAETAPVDDFTSAETAPVDSKTSAETAPTGAKTALHKRRKNKRTEKTKEKNLGFADANQTLASVEERIEKRQQERESKRVALLNSNSTLLRKELNGFWRDTISNYHSGMRALPLNVAQTSALYGKQKKFMSAMHGESFSAFIDFSIAHWFEIMGEVFHWMTNAPEIVDAWFFLKHFDKFFNVYEKRDRLLKQWENIDESKSKDDVESESVRRERKKLEAERQKLEIERRKGRRLASSPKKRDVSDALKNGEFKFKEEDD